MLVEAPPDANINLSNQPVNSGSFQTNKPEKYLRSNTVPNLDTQLKDILHDYDLSDREKWALYNQSLQRFLFFLNDERRKQNKPATSSIRSNLFSSEIPHTGQASNNFQNFPNYGFQNSQVRMPMNNSQHQRSQHNQHIDELPQLPQLNDDDIPSLPENDSDLEEENNLPRAVKRVPLTHYDNIPKRKRTAIPSEKKKAIYSQMYRPALNRWLIDQTRKHNIDRTERVRNEYTPEIINVEMNEIEDMDTFETRRGKKRTYDMDMDDFVDQYSITKKRSNLRDLQPQVVLKRSEVDNYLSTREQDKPQRRSQRLLSQSGAGFLGVHIPA